MVLKAEQFQIIGAECKKHPNNCVSHAKHCSKQKKDMPYKSMIVLGILLISCLMAEIIMTHDPKFMDLANTNIAPNKEFYFGTDAMGRDLFSMIWYGGRISLFIGIFATLISTSIGVIYGTISAFACRKLDDFLMRFTEIILSIPSILLILFLQGIIGQATPISIAIVIGITRWIPIAKIVRSEVKQLKNMDYVLASKIAGGSFFHILKKHLLPNFMPSIMFMVVTDIGTAIGIESTLSFLGLGLPLDVISWGSMLSLAKEAVLSNHWWVMAIPGMFLVITLICMTHIGHHIQNINNKRCSHL